MVNGYLQNLKYFPSPITASNCIGYERPIWKENDHIGHTCLALSYDTLCEGWRYCCKELTLICYTLYCPEVAAVIKRCISISLFCLFPIQFCQLCIYSHLKIYHMYCIYSHYHISNLPISASLRIIHYIVHTFENELSASIICSFGLSKRSWFWLSQSR